MIDVTGGAGNDAIHLAQDNTIHGFNIAMENAAATGIVDNGGTVGTLNISNMNVGVDPDGAGALLGNLGQAISITHGGTGGSMTFGTVSSGGGATGIALGGALVTSFSATGGTLSGHTTSEFAISGGSGNVSYGGTIGDGTGRRPRSPAAPAARSRCPATSTTAPTSAAASGFRQHRHHHRFHRHHQDAEYHHRRRRLDDQQHRVDRQLHRWRA